MNGDPKPWLLNLPVKEGGNPLNFPYKIIDTALAFFTWIDDFLIGGVGKFSHWTQRLVGLDSVFWGRTCLIYYVVEQTARMLLEWNWWYLLVIPFIAIISFAVNGALNDKRPQIGDCITANVYKYAYRGWRIIQLAGLLPDILYSVKNGRPSGGMGLTLALYFVAVDDLPSQPSKLRVWLESLVPDPLPSEGSARSPIWTKSLR